MAAKKDSRPLVVRLTPPGVGAVAVVLVDGPEATHVLSECFSPNRNRPLADLPIGRIVLGRWGGPEGEELIVCRRAEDRVEIHPHGGRAAVDRVVQDLLQRGAAECSWQEWFALDADCPIRAAAHIALAAAPTQRTAAILLDQFHGALRRDLERAIALANGGDVEPCADLLAGLASRCEFGRHLVHPWKVVLAGPPNVGKSSLINALVGYERAVVYDQPGTTRDVVTAYTAIDGWPVELSDTAGLRTSSDPLESEGVHLTERVVRHADLVVFVLDATSGLKDADEWPMSRIDAGSGTLVAVNKIDLVDATQRAALRLRCNSPDGRLCFTSAVSREGVDGLLSAIARILVPCPPSHGAAVPFERYQADAVDGAMVSLSKGRVSAAVVGLQSLLRQG